MYQKKRHFVNEGFLKIKNFMTSAEKKKIVRVFLAVLEKYIEKKEFSKFRNLKSLENERLHKYLISLRKGKPLIFSNFYDELKLNAELRSIFYSKKFLKIFSYLLNTNISNLYLNGFMFRIDSPIDNKNILEWHQDGSYYEQTYPKFNAMVCWLPVTNNNEYNGTLKFVPNSHKKLIKTKKQKKNASEQFSIKVSDKNKILNLDSSFGDANFLHINIKHKSGINKSNFFRLTIGCRCHDTSKKFNLGREVFVYNKTKKTSLL
tara:strand:+ start:41527 stop:42312 length:786 start_codon:yes stop_codon:yes gene_type:complete